MTARRPAEGPTTATRLVETAARLLATEGVAAVSARRVTAEAGVSTMAVYHHFGSMEALVAAVRREGFTRFGSALERPSTTADPVADWLAQGWAYRHFALNEPHLYTVMFGLSLMAHWSGPDEDVAAAAATFGSLLRRLESAVAAGRLRIDDVLTAGEVTWAAVHGHTTIELAGYHQALGRDPVESYGECLLRMAIGFGDDPDAAAASLDRARRRAQRAGQLAPTAR